MADAISESKKIPLSPPPRILRIASDSEEYEDGEDDNGLPIKKKKRRTKHKSTLPAWTKGVEARKKVREAGDRQRSTDRTRSNEVMWVKSNRICTRC